MCVSVCSVHTVYVQAFVFIRPYIFYCPCVSCVGLGVPSLSASMRDCWFLLCARHRPALFPKLCTKTPMGAWPFLSFTFILLPSHPFACDVFLSLSLVFPVDLEQSCLSKDECGYKTIMRCRIFFFVLFFVFFVFCIQRKSNCQ